MTSLHPEDPDPFASHIIKDLSGTAGDRRTVNRVSTARRLVAMSTRFLPPAERARYLEEFGAELDAITTAGGSRRARAAYAARQLGSSWQLGSELRALRRLRDDPAEAARPDTPAIAPGMIHTPVSAEAWATCVGGEIPPRLIEGAEPRPLVMTEAVTKIGAAALNIRSGSLGVSGPRGVGKSTILRLFGTDADQNLRLVVWAPVDYQPREFIIHLFRRLCETVPHGPGDRSAIAVETRRHLEELRHLDTGTTSRPASLTLRSFLNRAGGHAGQRAKQPFTLPELVAGFRAYSGRVAAWQRSARGGDARVVIAIDEVDKIRDGDRAEAFLNDIKAVFDVPGCLYVVSLSEGAMARFARRTPSIRTAFDGAFDELVPVGPMTYRDSERLLFNLVTGVPRPFLALCHVLAGGLPRDLIRAVRALIDVTPAASEKSLPDMAGDLVRRDIESLRQASIRQLAENGAPDSLLAALRDRQWPGDTPRQFTEAALWLAAARDAGSGACRQACQQLVVALSFYATVREVFGPGPAQDHLVTCLKESQHSIIDDLAAARYAMGTDAGLAYQLLEQFRVRNGLGRCAA